MDHRESNMKPDARFTGTYPDDDHDTESAREIEQDIQRTRAEMDETLNALGEKLKPRRMLDDVIDMLRANLMSAMHGGSGSTSGTSGIMQDVSKVACVAAWKTAKRHPVPAALITAGVAWMCYDQFMPRNRRSSADDPQMYGGSYVDARTGQPYSRTYGNEFYDTPDSNSQDHTSSHGRQAMDSARAHASDMRHQFSDKAHHLRDRASTAAQSARQAGREAQQWTQSTIGGAVHSVQDSASRASHMVGDRLHAVREAASHATESLTHTVSRAAHTLSSTASQLGETASTGIHSLRENMQKTYHDGERRFNDSFRAHPLTVGAAVMGAGLLLGLLLPRTRHEDEWLGEHSDEMKERARSMAQQAMDRGVEAANATAHAAYEEAKRQGLTPEELKHRAENVIHKTVESAQSAMSEEELTSSDMKDKAKSVAQRTQEEAKQQAGSGQKSTEKKTEKSSVGPKQS